jgi:hypothetical protein
MVSRNFLEIDNNILYPRIDIAGEKSGITGMEFPLLNYIIYIFADFFGYQHWYGRLINLFVSSLGLWFFFKLARRYFSEKIAFNATLILTVSIWFQFSRKIMPDTFSMSIVIASIYYGCSYLDSSERKYSYVNLLIYVLLMSLGVLSKLPSGYLLVIFSVFLLDKTIPVKRKVLFSVVSFLGILPVVFWYYYWVPYLVLNFEFWHFFMGKPFSQGFDEIMLNLNDTFSKFYDTALKFIGFAVFLFGLGFSIINKDSRIYLLFILTILAFAVVVLKAGYTFPHHNYYIIPFVPVMALIAGYGLSKMMSRKFALILLIAISIEGVANQQHDFRIKEKDARLINLEKDLDGFSTREDLVIINSGDYPTPMYFAHRKGWVNTIDKILDKEYINLLRAKGLKYIVILKRSFGDERSLIGYKIVLQNDDYCIYELE